MRVKTLVLSSVAGMVLSATSVYLLTPGPGHAAPAAPATPEVAASPSSAPIPAVPATFNRGGTLLVEGRLGHERLGKGAPGETFLLLEIRGGDDPAPAHRAPSHLAVVIDRSGSMKGDRIRNARLGAKAAVDRLGDGDSISVVAFDTRPTLVVPRTTIDGSSRDRVKAAIDGITLGGDTCISCGMEEGMRELASSGDAVRRMILLSDGDATDGVRDVPGFRALAERARDRGCTVTTIGVGLGYNQRFLGAVAQESGGGHFFLEDAASVTGVLQAEAEQLRTTLATDAEALIDPGEGVEILSVADRAFTRRGRTIGVPLGGFARGEVKTVLLRVRVPTSTEGDVRVANVELGYRDRVKGERGRVEGVLGLAVGEGARAELDPIVAGRVARSGTGAALLRANELAAKGDLEGAQQVLAQQQQALAAAAANARAAAPKARAAELAKDFDGQTSSLGNASEGLKKSAPKPTVDRAVRKNEAHATSLFR